MNKRNSNGITLIALIITVIVLLILVSVTVKTVVNSGLFVHANNAVGKWSNSQEKEKKQIENIYERFNEIETPPELENPDPEKKGWVYRETLTSPNYPENYPNDLNEITTKKYEEDVISIMIIIRDTHLEGGCKFDYINIFDGPDISSPLILSPCDGQTGVIDIDSNVFTIQFVTDSSVTRKGYMFDIYTTTDVKEFLGNQQKPEPDPDPEPEPEKKVWEFVETLTSPNYPENYPNDAREITTRDYGPDVTAIKIVIKDMQLEGGCNYDFLQLYKAPDTNSSLILRTCDGKVGTLIIHGNVFTSYFITDGSVQRRGYLLEVYTTTDPNFLGCEEGWTDQEVQAEAET